MEKRNIRKERIGIVTSNKMDKSIVVSVVKRVNTLCTENSYYKPKSLLHTMKKMTATSGIPCALWKHVHLAKLSAGD